MILSAKREGRKPVGDNRIVSGPWSGQALGRRAIQDLEAIAEAMQARQRDAYEILEALLEQTALWRLEGAELPDGTPRRVLRRLRGLSEYDPGEWFAERTRRDETAYQERRRRALALAEWLREHAGGADAEATVRAVEKDICDSLEVNP